MDKYPTTPETESSNGKSQEPEAIPPLATADPAAESSEAVAETPEKETAFLPVLKNRNFLALWSGQVFSQLADKVYLVLTIALVRQPLSSARSNHQQVGIGNHDRLYHSRSAVRGSRGRVCR